MMKKLAWCGLVLMGLGGGCNGHVRLHCPVPRSDADDLKSAVCGNLPAGPVKTVMSPGPNIIHLQETVVHNGAPMRIALSLDGSEVFEDCTLLDHIPHDPNGRVDEFYSITVNIPNVKCDNCVLQILQVMTDKIQGNSCTYNPDDPAGLGPGNQCFSNYHSCADIQITGDVDIDDFECPDQPRAWPFRNRQPLVYAKGENGEWSINAENKLKTIALGGTFAALEGICMQPENLPFQTDDGEIVDNDPDSDQVNTREKDEDDQVIYISSGGAAIVFIAFCVYLFKKRKQNRQWKNHAGMMMKGSDNMMFSQYPNGQIVVPNVQYHQQQQNYQMGGYPQVVPQQQGQQQQNFDGQNSSYYNGNENPEYGAYGEYDPSSPPPVPARPQSTLKRIAFKFESFYRRGGAAAPAAQNTLPHGNTIHEDRIIRKKSHHQLVPDEPPI